MIWLLALLACSSEPQTFTLEGSVLEMSTIYASKQVQGHPRGEGVQLLIQLDRVLVEGDAMKTDAWHRRWRSRYRDADDAWSFSQLQDPLPATYPPGTAVIATVDEMGFLLSITPNPPGHQP